MVIGKKTRNGFWFKTGYSIFDVHTKNLGITPAFIYLFLRSYINKYTGVSFPTEQFIADTLGLSRKTVIRAIGVLKTHRFINIKKVKYQGRWVHNEYSFTSNNEWLTQPSIENAQETNLPLPRDKSNQNQETKILTKKINIKEINKKDVLLKEPEE